MAVCQTVSLFPEAGPYQPHSKCDILSVLNSIHRPKIGLYGGQLQNFAHIFVL